MVQSPRRFRFPALVTQREWRGRASHVVRGVLGAIAAIVVATAAMPVWARAQDGGEQAVPAPPRLTPAQVASAQLSLDAWAMLRFRGASLLPDSGTRAVSLIAHAGAPRVDGARSSATRDTLIAVHFDTIYWRPSLATGAVVRFVDSSGEISPITARIVARRAFRAPRKAGARAGHDDEWRIGWAYLLAVPSRAASAATAAFNGWSIVDVPTASKRETR